MLGGNPNPYARVKSIMNECSLNVSVTFSPIANIPQYKDNQTALFFCCSRVSPFKQTAVCAVTESLEVSTGSAALLQMI